MGTSQTYMWCGKCKQNTHNYEECEECEECEEYAAHAPTQLEFEGESKTIKEWASARGWHVSVIYNRLKLGWETEKVLTQPVRPKRVWRKRVVRRLPTPPEPEPPVSPRAPSAARGDHYYKEDGIWVAEIGGTLLSLSEWAKLYGLSPARLAQARALRGIKIDLLFVDSLFDLRDHKIEFEFEGDVWCLDAKALAERSGVPAKTIQQRLKRGWSIEEVLDPKAGDRRADNARRKRRRSITFRGRTQGLSEWARELGLKRVTLRERLKRMSVEQAFTQPLREIGKSSGPIEFQGKTQSLAAWARELGMSYHALRHRRQDGWSVEDTLTTPVGSPRQQ